MKRNLVPPAVLVVLLSLVMAASATGTTYRYTGYATSELVGDRGYATHEMPWNGGTLLKFVDSETRSRGTYRVCLVTIEAALGKPGTRCWRRVTHRSPESVFVGVLRATTPGQSALWPGRYVAKWYAKGRLVATWPFRTLTAE